MGGWQGYAVGNSPAAVRSLTACAFHCALYIQNFCCISVIRLRVVDSVCSKGENVRARTRAWFAQEKPAAEGT